MRVAVTAAARIANDKPVARLDAALALERKAALLAVPLDARGRACLTAEHAARGVAHPLDEQRERSGPAAGELDLDILTQAAAEAPGAARIGREFLFPDAQRRLRLDRLHRAAHDIRGKAGRRQTVPHRACSHAAVDEEDRGVAPIILAITGDDDAQGRRASGFCDDALAEDRRERLVDDGRETVADELAGMHGRGEARV